MLVYETARLGGQIQERRLQRHQLTARVEELGLLAMLVFHYDGSSWRTVTLVLLRELNVGFNGHQEIKGPRGPRVCSISRVQVFKGPDTTHGPSPTVFEKCLSLCTLLRTPPATVGIWPRSSLGTGIKLVASSLRPGGPPGLVSTVNRRKAQIVSTSNS